jgi:predicted HTH domain antitoxin
MNPEVKNWSEQAKHETEVAEYNLSGAALGAAAPYSENLVNTELNTKIKKLEVPLIGDLDEKEVLIALSAELYREGKITLKQAADTANLTLWDFLYELGRRKISYTNITIGDLQEELDRI